MLKAMAFFTHLSRAPHSSIQDLLFIKIKWWFLKTYAEPSAGFQCIFAKGSGMLFPSEKMGHPENPDEELAKFNETPPRVGANWNGWYDALYTGS